MANAALLPQLLRQRDREKKWRREKGIRNLSKVKFGEEDRGRGGQALGRPIDVGGAPKTVSRTT